MDRNFIPPRSSSTSTFETQSSQAPSHFQGAPGDPPTRRANISYTDELNLRRGNSDSFVTSANPHLPRTQQSNATEDETWREFLENAWDTHASRGPRSGSESAGREVLPAHGDESVPSYHSVGSAVAASRKRYASNSVTSNASTHKRAQARGMRPTTPPGQTGQSATRPAVIDLTTPSPLRGAISHPVQRSTSGGSIQLPRWQPDDEVSHCFVCTNAFGFWNRKHHCRKCGKVVCDGCSRHRITIPSQYIVQPPQGGTNSGFSSTFSALGASPPIRSLHIPGLNSSGSGSAGAAPSSAEGAEVVRVCNPCVPDPNLSPPPQTPVNGLAGPALLYNGFGMPPQYPTGQRPLGGMPPPIPERRGSGLSRFGNYSSNIGVGSNDRAFGVGFPASSGGPQPYTASTPQLVGGRRATMATGYAGPPNVYYPGIPARPHGPPLASSTLAHRPSRSATSIITQPLSQGFSSAHPTLRFPTHQAPRRVIPEEDECPICGRELPPKGANGNTRERERHVEDCIALHSFSSSNPPSSIARQPANADQSRQYPSFPGGPNASAVAPSASSLYNAPQGILSPSDVHPALRPTVSSSIPSSSSAPASQAIHGPHSAPRGNRMIIYRASEKDCLGEDGDTQECIICFEEFEPGAEMGRLECWCKFHRACIRRWWETKGPGSCPTHQLHD